MTQKIESQLNGLIVQIKGLTKTVNDLIEVLNPLDGKGGLVLEISNLKHSTKTLDIRVKELEKKLKNIWKGIWTIAILFLSNFFYMLRTYFIFKKDV